MTHYKAELCGYSYVETVEFTHEGSILAILRHAKKMLNITNFRLMLVIHTGSTYQWVSNNFSLTINVI